jgi:DNA-binding LytR/AlgR family response regulator
MNLSVFIMDDEEHAVETLSDYVAKTDGLSLMGTATDPISALPQLTGSKSPDIVLLDVDMPGMSGLELAGLLPRQSSIVFITSFREFGVEAFALSAVDYLLKPIGYPRFYQAIQRVKQQRTIPNVKERSFFFVKGDVKEKYLKVFIDKVIYITAAQNYIEIFLTDERIVTYLTLGEVLEELPSQDFFQVHRSFIINRKHIRAIEKGQLRMENAKLIPVGKTYEELFFKWLGPSFVISKRLQDH